MLKNFCRAGLLREEKEGQTFKYYSTKKLEEPKPEPEKKLTENPQPAQPNLPEFHCRKCGIPVPLNYDYCDSCKPIKTENSGGST